VLLEFSQGDGFHTLYSTCSGSMNQAGRTKPCSRIAITSCGVGNLLAAIC
jgi:hypothetical protein